MAPTGLLKKYSPLVRLAQKSLDIFIVFANLIVIYLIVQPELSLTQPALWTGEPNIILLGALTCALFYFFSNKTGLYRSWRTLNLRSEFELLCYTHLAVIMALLVIGYMTKTTAAYSREVLISWAISTPIIHLLLRALVRHFLYRMRVKGFNTRKVAVIGNGMLAQRLVRDISANDHMGMEVIGYYDDRNEFRECLDGVPQRSVLGNFSQAIESAKERKFDELYIALPMRAEQKISEMITALGDCSLNVHLVPDLLTYHLINSKTSAVGGMPVVSIYKSPLDDENSRLIKDAEDFFLSLAILSIIAIPMLLIALGVKLTSRGPVIFKQRRYGMGGEEITVWKFRTMSVVEDGNVVTQATKNDSRITPFGKFLRRTSLDELPQFINVLQGKMSIVGPRPHAVTHNELYRKVIDQYMLRHLVKPGITGWAQINGWRGETDSEYKMKKRIECDLDYINNWSLRLDLKIIFLTIFKGFVNRNAY